MAEDLIYAFASGSAYVWSITYSGSIKRSQSADLGTQFKYPWVGWVIMSYRIFLVFAEFLLPWESWSSLQCRSMWNIAPLHQLFRTVLYGSAYAWPLGHDLHYCGHAVLPTDRATMPGLRQNRSYADVSRFQCKHWLLLKTTDVEIMGVQKVQHMYQYIILSKTTGSRSVHIQPMWL